MEVEPTEQEALEIERGDVAGTFKMLAKGIYVDFYNSLAEMQKAPDSFPIWEMLRDHTDALYRALEYMRNEPSNRGNPLLKSTANQAFLEKRAYDLLLMDQALIQEFNPHKDTSVLAHKIVNDREFRMIYALWRWCQDGAQVKSGGYAGVATEYNKLTVEVENVRRNSFNEIRAGNPQYGVDLDSPAHQEDAQNDSRVLRCLFSLLRCGNINEAVSLAHDTKVPLFSTYLRQYAYLIDPSLSPFDQNDPNWSIGQRRPTAMKVLKRIADEDKTDTPRRLLLATVCGHVKPLLDLATHSTDRLWSMANAAIINMLNKEVTGQALFDAPETVESIFDEIRTETTGYFSIYGYLLREDWDGLISWMVEYAEERERLEDQQVRFMGALATVARLKQVQHDETAASILFTNMIDSYVEKQLFSHIPFFASFLPRQTAEDRLLDIMENIEDDHTRAAYLLAMEDCDFDRNAMVEAAGSNVGDNSAKTRVSNLRWLLMNGEQTLESAISQVNCLIRYFAVGENVTTVKVLLEHITDYRIHEAVRQLKHGVGYDQLGDVAKYNIEEFECHLLFFGETHPVVEKFNETSANLLAFVRENPEPQTSDASRRSGVASMNLARDTERHVERRKWQSEMDRLRRIHDVQKENAFDSCEKFFKHCGYLFATNDQPSKITELQKLRNMACKCVVDLLLNACVNTEDQKGILDIAVMIAQPQVPIGKLMSQESLRSTLQKIVKYTGDVFS